MIDLDSILAREELEELCNLYLECKLTPFEEIELEIILQNTSFKTSLITDVKKIMGFEKIAFLKFQQSKNERRRKWFLLFPSVAASVLIMLVAGMLFFIPNHNDDLTELIYCQVYANGKQVSREEALLIANRNLEKMEEFENKMKIIENIEKEKVDKFNNLKNIIP